ncbi:ABC transporter substrate-binding protein [Rathayibacter sp. AY1E9]|uniref:ABC transporter substrate-binding protein n=1 Tax=unclassified Rathayibacter TaxID=2609250 RepID=UPI000CE89AF3|nr:MULTISPECIES: ABC transporter substrate-binding protein [unclassified Rathayibacter]PPF15082.1 ABC transporter substrate-binding protein [Rathayibacter sp. AY1A4]PPG50131.1 ABC transporter substrate-binding protein [Rathayibacter sp. AY1E9]PPH07626.1 ABC transporter substrate-binding protein [Rathayibacter sp. AY1H3]PPH39623.1 ABC transporter substrate-binding protein [Rathayibacter sp. AY1E4]PPH45743.1 ABC transporter substrate-binding protein [Rathayibacter sp. AY1C9]
MSTHRRRPAALALAALTLLALTGCGASEQIEPESTAAAGEGTTSYPLMLDNCGTATTVTAPPQRVVSLDQNSTEILLSLGLEDRMVGTASWTDPVLETLASANESVPRLADNAPTYEVLLGADPDFVTASFGRHYAPEGVASRDRLAETGIGSYLAPSDCDNGASVNGGSGTRTVPLTVDVLYQEIHELAEVFDVQQRGDALVAQLQERAAAATEGVDLGGRSVAFWFADTKTPYMAGGYNFASMLGTTTGMTNVFADRTEDWPAVGWESVVAADPDVLVLGDLQRDRFPGDRLDDKTAFLRSDPLTSSLPAVQDGRFIALHGAEMNPSIRFVDGLEKIRAWWDENGASL